MITPKTIVQGEDYRSALEITNAIDTGELEMPVEVRCESSSYSIHEGNLAGVRLGAMIAGHIKSMRE